MDIFESYMQKAAKFLSEDEEDDVIDTEETDTEDTDIDVDDDSDELEDTDIEDTDDTDTEETEEDVDLESMTKAELIDYIHQLQNQIENSSNNGMCPCPDCNGEGVIEDENGDETECETCGGSGEVPCEDDEMELDLDNPICPNCGNQLNVIDDEDEEYGIGDDDDTYFDDEDVEDDED